MQKVSYYGEDGRIFTPLGMDEKGNPGSYRNSCRPSDTSIIIRGIINNWISQLWRLLPLLRYFDMEEDAARVETVIKKHIQNQLEKENNILDTAGGGEDISDFGDASNRDATLLTIKYLMTGDPIWEEYEEQGLKKAWLLSCMWADMPQFFGMYGNSDLGYYYDQYLGLFSAGGMHDLTAVEANLFAVESFESEFAADYAEVLHNARLGSFIRDNGGMYMVILKCPNFYYRDERHSEMLMYGGVYSWGSAEKESAILQEWNERYMSHKMM